MYLENRRTTALCPLLTVNCKSTTNPWKDYDRFKTNLISWPSLVLDVEALQQAASLHIPDFPLPVLTRTEAPLPIDSNQELRVLFSLKSSFPIGSFACFPSFLGDWFSFEAGLGFGWGIFLQFPITFIMYTGFGSSSINKWSASAL